MRKSLIHIFILLCFLLFGCSENEEGTFSAEADDVDEPLPEYVLVPSDDVISKVAVKSKSEAKVGDWITLNSTRETSGTWEKVKRTELAEDVQWYTSNPNGFEPEVAANLSWKVEPSGRHEFNLPTLSDINSMDRRVKFKSPGIYKIQGFSAFPVRSTSNTLVIKIE